MDIRNIKNKSKEQLRGRYWYIFIVVFLFIIISAASLPIIIGVLILGPLTIGVAHVLLDFTRKPEGEDNYELLFEAFKNNLANSSIAYLLIALFVFLWSLLLVIPGIIKSLSYSMTRFIMADNPSLSPTEAITQSRAMMRGNKLNLFALYLSYIGWYILGAFTFGIAIIYIAPYINVAVANFYLEVNQEKEIPHILIEENIFE